MVYFMHRLDYNDTKIECENTYCVVIYMMVNIKDN